MGEGKKKEGEIEMRKWEREQAREKIDKTSKRKNRKLEKGLEEEGKIQL